MNESMGDEAIVSGVAAAAVLTSGAGATVDVAPEISSTTVASDEPHEAASRMDAHEDSSGTSAMEGRHCFDGVDGSTASAEGPPAMDAEGSSAGAGAVEGQQPDADDRPLAGDSLEAGAVGDLTDISCVTPLPEDIHPDVEAGNEGCEQESVCSVATESVASLQSRSLVSQADGNAPGDVESQGAPSAADEDGASTAASVEGRDTEEANDAASVRSQSFLRVANSSDADGARYSQTSVVDVEQAVRVGVSKDSTIGRANSMETAGFEDAVSQAGSASYHSCSSTIMADVHKSPKQPARHETMDLSLSDEEEWDTLGTASGRHKLNRTKRTAGALCTTKRIMYASVALIVLMGLGIGLSKRSRDEASAARAAEAAHAALLAELQPTTEPSTSPSLSMSPSNVASSFPSMVPSYPPSYAPSGVPTPSPSSNPSTSPSSGPTFVPSSSPTTSAPTVSPTISLAPTKPFIPGDLAVRVSNLGIRMSTGLKVRLIARTGQKTQYVDGTTSKDRYHAYMDGAGIVKLDKGYVYVSNSENDSGTGGVFGLYFNDAGEVTGYKPLLTGTTWNCGGGVTPWGTWVSCEEHPGGQCWQVDPDPKGANHASPKKTVLGGNGGQYESVAVDNSNPNRPVFFTTEDHSWGSLRRFEANGSGWDALHKGGKTTFLRILGNGRYEWTANEQLARRSASIYYKNSEGVSYHDGTLYFTAKVTQTLLMLNLKNGTYKTETTGGRYKGEGGFNAQPDQILIEKHKRWIYFTEDGGNPGIYVRDKHTGTYTALFESDGTYKGDETVGIALSPDRRRLYAGYQEAGRLMEFTREDGLPFE